jgi:hypothetical protein
MTPREAQAIFERLFVAFPYWGEYLEKQPNTQGTMGEWCRMLSAVKKEHADAAVGKWLSGEIEPPDKPWEVGMLPLKIRAMAGKIADAAAKRQKTEAMERMTEERLQTVKRSTFPRLLRMSLVSGYMLRDGLITEERNSEILADLMRQLESKTDEVDEPEEIRNYNLSKRTYL